MLRLYRRFQFENPFAELDNFRLETVHRQSMQHRQCWLGERGRGKYSPDATKNMQTTKHTLAVQEYCWTDVFVSDEVFPLQRNNLSMNRLEGPQWPLQRKQRYCPKYNPKLWIRYVNDTGSWYSWQNISTNAQTNKERFPGYNIIHGKRGQP